MFSEYQGKIDSSLVHRVYIILHLKYLLSFKGYFSTCKLRVVLYTYSHSNIMVK